MLKCAKNFLKLLSGLDKDVSQILFILGFLLNVDKNTSLNAFSFRIWHTPEMLQVQFRPRQWSEYGDQQVTSFWVSPYI